MVFKMITSGKHIKKINGKFLKDQEFNLDINPNHKNRVYLKTHELEDGKHKTYKNAFDSVDDFMTDFQNNNNSLFELNKNISRPRYVTPKYRGRPKKQRTPRRQIVVKDKPRKQRTPRRQIVVKDKPRKQRTPRRNGRLRNKDTKKK
tara:strand:- start:1264 stop:1704 length:441 start_codon:yes stop_codon:yes gene_type:complete